MTAKVVNIKLDKGCDFSKTLSFTDDNDSVVNLTGFALTAKIRKHPTSSSPAAFTVGITSAAGGGGIISMTDSTSGILTSGRYYYDVIGGTSSGPITKYFEGSLIVSDTISS